MKRIMTLVALALVTQVGVASAQRATGQYMGSLGFHDVDAPLGGRWWLTDKVAIDAGLGFGSHENTAVDKNMSNWALDLGVPIMLKSFDRLHFLVRPGVMFTSQEVVVDPGPPVRTDNDTQMRVGAELEAEVFVTENCSVSAAQGFAIVNENPAVGPSSSGWGTTGANFTSLGFHVYLFGRK